jgi:hypothetical protein
MKKTACRWLKILAATLAIFTLIGLSLLTGWAMDQSISPPFGGGWCCYVACAAAV